MTKKIDREAIIAELKREALDDPEIGWLSDLSGRDLEWNESDEVIVFGEWDGSIDVGQLAGIVEGLIDKNSQALLSRLEQAEKNADTYQTLYEQRAESLEQAEQALDATERQVVARSGETAAERIWRGRAEQAEQAVARVRELGDAWKSRGEHSMKYSETLQWPVAEAIHEGGADMVNNANLIYRALDGDGRG